MELSLVCRNNLIRHFKYVGSFGIHKRLLSGECRSVSESFWSRMPKMPQENRNVEMGAYHVTTSGDFGRKFSHSQIHVFPYCFDKHQNIVDPYLIEYEESKKLNTFILDLKTLFTNGMKDTGNHIDSIIEDLSKIKKTGLEEAVTTLTLFLDNKDFHEECLSNLAENVNSPYTESEITTLLINHLFLPLVSHKDVRKSVMANECRGIMNFCPCTKQCDTEVKYGDTGFGSDYLWFGRADIMLYPPGGGATSILVKDTKALFSSSTEDEDEQDEENTNDIYRRKIMALKEIKRHKNQLRQKNIITEIASQAVTFSFLQRKHQIEQSRNTLMSTLIPTILTSRNHFDIYIYDSENDILLRNIGHPLPIFQRKHFSENIGFHPRFNLDSVFYLWMLINHTLLQPQFTETQISKLKGTCGIKREIIECNLMKRIEGSLTTGSSFLSPEIKDGYSLLKVT